MEIILEKVKTYIGVALDETGFDVELLVLINAAFSTLKQLGFLSTIVVDETTEFPELDDEELMALVEAYVCVKPKSIFDATASPTIKAVYDSHIKEMESRIEMLCSSKVEVVYE